MPSNCLQVQVKSDTVPYASEPLVVYWGKPDDSEHRVALEIPFAVAQGNSNSGDFAEDALRHFVVVVGACSVTKCSSNVETKVIPRPPRKFYTQIIIYIVG